MALKEEHIVSKDPKVVSGELVFAGTRVPVRTLIDHLTADESLDEFLKGFPTISRQQAAAYLEMTLQAADHLADAHTAR